MFNKAKNSSHEHKSATPVPAETHSPAVPRATTSSARPSLSVIGGHTQVEGDINSDEDLTIEGRVRGIITCKQHTVTLGANGYINGDVFAHTLHVSGEIIGNLVVLHRATIHKGAQVSGTIVAPCLVLEDGSVFHGSIDMDPDNDILTSTFNTATDNTTKTAALNSTSGTNSAKTPADQHVTSSATPAEQETISAKANN